MSRKISTMSTFLSFIVFGVRMKYLTVYRLMAIIFMGMLLAACVPWAEFTVEPTPVVAGKVATFDASPSLVSEKEHGQVTYSWNFGDGTPVGSGKIIEHTFATKGNYSVTLTITPSKGKAKVEGGIVTKTINVASTATEGVLSAQVQGSDDVLIPNAKIVIGALNVTSDAKGIAVIANVPANADQTVTITKAGYVSQTVRTTIATSKTTKLLVTLLPVKETRSISKAEVAQVIATKTLGASVTLPANALVNANNQSATSAISAHLSPFDIKSQDMRAMLGNGRGRDASGKMVNLISAGVFSIDFYDAQNGHLQLASGKTADIQVDLPYASINGKALAVGTVIPLWHFDVALGLWLAEGSGTVVASQTSNVGLAVKATVTHFSTWSWNFPIDNLGSVTISCVDTALQLTACDLTAVVVLPDNSYYFKYATIAAEVSTVIDMPTVGNVSWTGATNQGQQGSVQSSTTGNVVVALAAAQTDNFVQCKLVDLSSTDCNVIANITLSAGGGSLPLSYYIPSEGAWVRTAFYTTSPIAWLASSGFSMNGLGQLVRFEGSATSAATGNVNITLSNQILAENKLLVLSCDTTADIYPAGTYLGQPSLPTPVIETLTSCNIGVSVLGINSSFNYTSPSIPPGVAVNLLVPPMATMDTVYMGAAGKTAQNSYVNFYTSSAASALTTFQTILFRLHNLIPT
jgi:PKD repeat protein